MVKLLLDGLVDFDHWVAYFAFYFEHLDVFCVSFLLNLFPFDFEDAWVQLLALLDDCPVDKENVDLALGQHDEDMDMGYGHDALADVLMVILDKCNMILCNMIPV